MNPQRRLYGSDPEKLSLEERNLCFQHEEVVRLVEAQSASLDLTPEIIKSFDQIAIADIYSCAGQFRTWSVKIAGSQHEPPKAKYVDGLVQQMCAEVNTSTAWKPVLAAAYVLWKLAWIHPFGGGNGRTARAAAYLTLCVRAGFRLPGKSSIFEYLAENRSRYVDALADADSAWQNSVIDLSRLESLLSEMLMRQIAPLKPQSTVRQSRNRPRAGRVMLPKLPPLGDSEGK